MSTLELEHKPRQDWTPEERTQGLTMVVLCNGNTRRAADNLVKAGLPIPRGTLEQWKNRSHREEYLVIHEREAPGLKLDLAEKLQGFVDTIADTLVDSADLVAKQIQDPDISLKERSQSMYYLSTSAGIANNNAQQLRGEPSTIVEHRTVHDSARGLKRLGLVVESTATEVPMPSLPSSRPSEQPHSAELNARTSKG